MSEVSIKVNIAGRTYPLTVSSSEEELIRKAEQQIEQSINVFQQNYAVKDKQDLLAMAALQVASRNQTPAQERVVEKTIEVEPEITPQLRALEELATSYLD
jgi:cell division protein ZapA (FtsZ GTPase activity inhibitor)